MSINLIQRATVNHFAPRRFVLPAAGAAKMLHKSMTAPRPKSICQFEAFPRGASPSSARHLFTFLALGVAARLRLCCLFR